MKGCEFSDLPDGFRIEVSERPRITVRLEPWEFVVEAEDQEPERFELIDAERRLLQ